MKTPLLISLNSRLPAVEGIAMVVDSNKMVSSTNLDREEEIRVRAETITPLLKEIIEFRPSRYWGINE